MGQYEQKLENVERSPMLVAERFTYSSAPERRERIVQFVTDQGYCTITELSTLFAVSEMTIRRDVSRLVRDGKLRGFHGGVGSLSPQEMTGRDYSDRDLAMADAKRAIAERAIAMISSNAVIAIDAGTTATQFASLLPLERGTRVVTHSLSAVSVLAGAGDIEVNCLGGVLHPESLSFAGPSTLAAISNLQVETMFLAASGLNDRGAFCGTGFDAITKRALIEVSEHVVLLADSSKFATSAMVKICGWDAIDTVVMDSGITEEQKAMLVEKGVALEIV
jgi:DeoR family transcriptional regulator, aga operon transcriptional repressor